ncbi:MAG: hypothetical protein RL609_1038 [Bacteroidota bacterium]|jgi:hypothetical protein
MSTNFGKGYDSNAMEFIAISSSEMEVRLAWLLNVQLRLNMGRVEDLEMPHINGGTSKHCRFKFYSDAEKLEVNLFENKSPDGVLIPEWAKWDFIMKLDHERESMVAEWLPKIKSIPGVAAAIDIDLTKTKTLERLIQASFQPFESR